MTERIYNISIAGCSRVAHLHAKAIQSIPNAKEDTVTLNNCDPTIRNMQFQIEDFLYSTGEDGRRTVELFSAIYRSTQDNVPVKFQLKPEPGFA